MLNLLIKLLICRYFHEKIFKLHGVPKVIASDRDAKFTGNFWKGLFKGLGTQLKFNIAYHPQMDGKTKRLNQVLEDMLRMYVMDKTGKSEDYLHLVEFSYNNNYMHISFGRYESVWNYMGISVTLQFHGASQLID